LLFLLLLYSEMMYRSSWNKMYHLTSSLLLQYLAKFVAMLASMIYATAFWLLKFLAVKCNNSVINC